MNPAGRGQPTLNGWAKAAKLLQLPEEDHWRAGRGNKEMQDLESWVKNCSFVWHFLWDQMGSLEKEKARPGVSADSCWHCWAERKPRMTRLESVFITGQWRRVCICLYSSFEASESYEAWFIEVTSFYQHSSQGQDDEEEEQVWATWVFVPFGLVEELDLKDSYFESKSIQFHWSDSIEVFISAVSIVDAQSVSSWVPSFSAKSCKRSNGCVW